MSKIKVLVDSAASLTPEEAQRFNLEVLPLSVILEGQEYRDGIDITVDEICQRIKNGALPTTSQPNLGVIINAIEKFKDSYDHLLFITLPKTLSGTYQSVATAAAQIEFTRFSVIDSASICGPQRSMAIKAAQMASEGKTLEEIVAMTTRYAASNQSFILPVDLKHLKRGGRISPTAAALASMLKIRAVLKLVDGGQKIDKFGTARTEAKTFEMVIEDFKKEGFDAAKHLVYVPHSEALDTAKRFGERLKQDFPNASIEYIQLPAVLTCHAGLGCIAVQFAVKN